MKFYEKAFLTISGAVIMSSCMPLHKLTTRGQGTVVEKKSCYYVDSDGDNLADNCIYISSWSASNNQRYIADYLQTGDTIKYHTTSKKPVYLTADVIGRNVKIDSVNNRSAKELKKIYEVNLMRQCIEQEKAR